MRLEAGAATHIGQRPKNEDCHRVFHADPRVTASGRGSLLAVADGLGGHRGGADAARMAVDQLWLYYQYPASRFHRDDTLVALVQAANRAVWHAAQQQGPLHRMGCTLSCLHFDAGLTRAFWAHVGDSRIYILRSGRLEQLTEDHVDSEHKHVLTKHIGLTEQVDVDTGALPAQAGERWLLCTDGLAGGATHDEIESTMKAVLNPQDAAEQLVTLAARTGLDNATAVVVDVLP